MLERAAGLTPPALDAIAELEQQVLAADGGRLKLAWNTLRGRSGASVEDLLWWDDGRLLGFLGLYEFGSPIELAGMVDPSARRRGIGTALLDAALPLCRERGQQRALLVVPRGSAGGRALSLGRGAVLDHSEHALVLTGPPAEGSDDARVALRAAGPADTAMIARLMRDGFGIPESETAGQGQDEHDRGVIVEYDGEPIGTLRLDLRGDEAWVYGFVIDAAWRGRGIGRDVLRRVCRQTRANGAPRIGLEVEVDNDRALGLYTSVGFAPISTEDYYALAVSGS